MSDRKERFPQQGIFLMRASCQRGTMEAIPIKTARIEVMTVDIPAQKNVSLVISLAKKVT